MASEQVMNEAIARAVAEATGVAIQTMAERMHDILGTKIGGTP